MTKRTLLSVFAAIMAVAIISGSSLFADEGMWLLNNLPLKQLKDKYNFVPNPEWIEHVQKSSARLPNCSSSFVSSDGLLMTNWHCAQDVVKALSTPRNDYYTNGFYARTLSEELKTNLNVRVLMKMDNVTARVNYAISRDATGNLPQTLQKIAQQIEKEYPEQGGLKCEVVALYQGGQYHNYCYKIYNDIRLVFMLERNVGFFGGDTDNFEYPRHTLDISFLRAYENGKPAKISYHLKWSKFGAKQAELLFASGHPGRTARLLTSDALKTERDVRVPFLLDLFRRRELTIQQFMLRSKKNKSIGESDLFSWQNSRKLYVGKIRGLQDLRLLEIKKSFEKKVISEADPASRLEFIEGLLLVREAQENIRKIYPAWLLLVRGLVFDGKLFSGAPRSSLNLEYEEHKLRDSLTHLVEVLGADNPMVLAMIEDYGFGPADIAHKLVYGPVLISNNFVSFIRSGSIFEKQRMQIEVEKETRGYAKISNVLSRIYGTNLYPDATFTLRLTFGTVKGYDENGKPTLPWTTIGGAYKHALEFDNKGDYKLPARWWKRRSSVKLNTPLNFISDLDITGGNSGSPVFNKNLEIVGIVFDSNINGLVSDYDYNYSLQARAISVHSAGIIELLSKIYHADRLVRELTGR